MLMYSKVLRDGCRCVELDCWNGDSGEPIIFHGFTLTSKISFESVIKIIKDYSFVSSKYPVILSLENHCGPQQQLKMAEIMKENFGNAIVLRKNYLNAKRLPSPEELKEKFIIKCKMNPGDAPELDEIVFLQSASISILENGGIPNHPADMISLVENKLNSLDPMTLIEYNKSNLTRIYPVGNRFDSSNYNPSPWWVCGSQLVALNCQTIDKYFISNFGKFLDNGRCGYVLKPSFLLSTSQKYAFNVTNYVPNYPIKLQITVYSARNLPKPKNKELSNPFVKLIISGTELDCNAQQTNVIRANSFNPVWQKTYTFSISMPELAVLSIIICDTPDSIIPLPLQLDNVLCYFALPVACINTGYRIVPLYAEGKELQLSDLFCKFTIDINKQD